MPDRDEIDETSRYYREILPFYEKESIARSHLVFWRGLARDWSPRRILEIGCGLGRITSALSRHAPSVGIDVSLEMLRRASRRGRGSRRPRFVSADMRDVAFHGVFDLVVAPSDPLSHLTGTEDRRRALRSVARQLSAGGRFVLDGLAQHRRAPYVRDRRIRHASGEFLIHETWTPIGEDALWRARYTYTPVGIGAPPLEASFLARAWNPDELPGFFDSCGLSVEESWGGFDRRPFRPAARRLIVVARAR